MTSMQLELVGVSPAEIVQATRQADHADNEAALPDETQIELLQSLTDAGMNEVDTLLTTSSKFQEEIQQLSEEMKLLETQSATLYHQLTLRNAALDKFEPVVQQRVIPSSIVEELCFGEIGPQWRAALIVAVQFQQGDFSKKLLLKASNRVKEFYMAQVRRLRRPGADAQAVQATLIHNASLYDYLVKRHPEIAQVIQQAYINTMKWYYQMLLEKYLRWIGRQPIVPSDASKVIGEVVFAANRSSFFSFASSSAEFEQNNTFSVGARPTILSRDNVAMAWGTPSPPQGFHPEVLVHSLVTVLQDTLTMEYRVLSEAFHHNNADAALESIFGASMEHSQQILDRLLGSWDVFDLLLSLKLLQASDGPQLFKDFRDKRIDSIWARLNEILEKNSKSIETAATRPSATRNIGPEPHTLTTNVAAMLTGILQLTTDLDLILAALRQLIGVYEALVTKLSKFSSAEELFLYNNYFLLSSLLADIEGPVAKELASHFKLLYKAYTPTSN